MKTSIDPGRPHTRGSSKMTVTLTAPGQTVTGKVFVRHWGQVLTSGELADGKVTLKLGAFPKPGEKTLRVRYVGSSTVETALEVVTLRVVR